VLGNSWAISCDQLQLGANIDIFLTSYVCVGRGIGGGP
jgi:hypothetical protein